MWQSFFWFGIHLKKAKIIAVQNIILIKFYLSFVIKYGLILTYKNKCNITVSGIDWITFKRAIWQKYLLNANFIFLRDQHQHQHHHLCNSSNNNNNNNNILCIRDRACCLSDPMYWMSVQSQSKGLHPICWVRSCVTPFFTRKRRRLLENTLFSTLTFVNILSIMPFCTNLTMLTWYSQTRLRRTSWDRPYLHVILRVCDNHLLKYVVNDHLGQKFFSVKL